MNIKVKVKKNDKYILKVLEKAAPPSSLSLTTENPSVWKESTLKEQRITMIPRKRRQKVPNISDDY